VADYVVRPRRTDAACGVEAIGRPARSVRHGWDEAAVEGRCVANPNQPCGSAGVGNGLREACGRRALDWRTSAQIRRAPGAVQSGSHGPTAVGTSRTGFLAGAEAVWRPAGGRGSGVVPHRLVGDAGREGRADAVMTVLAWWPCTVV